MTILEKISQKLQKKITLLREDFDISNIVNYTLNELQSKVENAPFKHVVIDNFLTPEYYKYLEQFFIERLAEGISEDHKERSKFHPFYYKNKTYDGYLYGPKFGDNKYFDFFLSNTFIDFISKIFRKQTNSMLSLYMHYHPALNRDGWIHNDDACNSFYHAQKQTNGILLGGDQYYDKDHTPPQFVGRRTIAFLYYLNNDTYESSDGGETALFSGNDEKDLFEKVEPHNNRLLAFNINQDSFHAFRKNLKNRCCIVGFLFEDEKLIDRGKLHGVPRKDSVVTHTQGGIGVPQRKKVIVVFGGSSNLKNVLFEQIPSDCTVVNISRVRTLDGNNVYNLQYDIEKSAPDEIFQKVTDTFGEIDIVVYGTVSRRHKNINDLSEKDLYQEWYASVMYPIKIMQTLEKKWGTPNGPFVKKFVAISSIASLVAKDQWQNLAAYSIGKAGMNFACAYYAMRFKKNGIRTEVLCPGGFGDSKVVRTFNEIFWEIVLDETKVNLDFKLHQIP